MSQQRSHTTVLAAPGLVHPGPRPTAELITLLKRFHENESDLVHTRRPGTLPHLLDQAPARVVLYMHRQNVPGTWVTALERYVEEGGSLLALHSASASLKGNTQYGRLLGGVFSGHGPVSEFSVHDTGTGVTDQPFTILDERYQHQLTQPVSVLLVSDTEPVCWTHTVGKGRVAYLSLGHCTGVFSHPAVRSVMEHLWAWLSAIAECRELS